MCGGVFTFCLTGCGRQVCVCNSLYINGIFKQARVPVYLMCGIYLMVHVIPVLTSDCGVDSQSTVVNVFLVPYIKCFKYYLGDECGL